MSEKGTDSAVLLSSSLDMMDDTVQSTAKEIQTTTGNLVVSPLTNAEPFWTMTAAANNNNGDTSNADASKLNFEITGEISTAGNQYRANSVIASTKWYVVSDSVTDSINNRISDLESQVASLQDENDELSSALDNALNRLSALDGTNGSVSNLSNRMSGAESDISNLSNRTSDAESNISNLSNRMTTAESGVSNLSGRMGTAENNITDISNTLATNTVVPKYASGKDMNTLDTGWWYVPASGVSNNTLGTCFVLCLKMNNDSVQIATSYSTNKMHWRLKNNGNWNSWHEITST